MELFSRSLLGVLSSALFLSTLVSALGQKDTIAFSSGNGSYLLATKSSSVNIILDAADWPGALRVANDLAVDFGRVTGLNGSLTTVGKKGSKSASNIFNVTGIAPDWSVGSGKGKSGNGGGGSKGKGTIIAGTIGNSSLIDALIRSGKLDVSAIKGEWEAFVSAVIKNPANGTDEALVIAGKTS